MDFQIRSATASPGERQAIRDIFFLASDKKSFSDDLAKEDFFSRWTELYFSPPQGVATQVLVALSSEQKVLAYLTGCLDSRKADSYLEQYLPSQMVFADLFINYPAHLHINARPEARGLGVGSALIEHFCHWCINQSAVGVHIVTSVGHRNNAFYRRNLFTFEAQRLFNSRPILFMGRSFKN